jgi:hypothetical protein
MTPAEKASFAFQAPAPVDVCPHCKHPTEVYLVFCDGHLLETHRCRAHGDIVPLRAAGSLGPDAGVAG